jgi:hypothetical protein
MTKMTSSPSLIAPLVQHLSCRWAWFVRPQMTHGHADPARVASSLRANASGCLVLAGVLVCAFCFGRPIAAGSQQARTTGGLAHGEHGHRS